ncbi:hypothetical protein [Streptomyces halobius]|uniref:Uncharacterized protein n=1 Tax=Streptomyces halobius TaxID=2879846 RepID=A0ABY4MAV9_9ACTN|nr:hypothetical protein [Streptomyces halobius]UQA94472.1 hypothetical protein K9S39_23745 [Streptomyces halobius]
MLLGRLQRCTCERSRHRHRRGGYDKGRADCSSTYVDGLDPAQGMACLHEPGSGTAWIQRTGDVHLIGGPAIADDLATHVQMWVNLARPVIAVYCTVFERTDTDEPVYHPVEWCLHDDYPKQT